MISGSLVQTNSLEGVKVDSRVPPVCMWVCVQGCSCNCVCVPSVVSLKTQFDVKRHMRGMQQAGIPGTLVGRSCFITSNLSLLPAQTRCFKALSLTLTYERVWEWEYIGTISLHTRLYAYFPAPVLVCSAAVQTVSSRRFSQGGKSEMFCPPSAAVVWAEGSRWIEGLVVTPGSRPDVRGRDMVIHTHILYS